MFYGLVHRPLKMLVECVASTLDPEEIWTEYRTRCTSLLALVLVCLAAFCLGCDSQSDSSWFEPEVDYFLSFWIDVIGRSYGDIVHHLKDSAPKFLIAFTQMYIQRICILAIYSLGNKLHFYVKSCFSLLCDLIFHGICTLSLAKGCVNIYLDIAILALYCYPENATAAVCHIQ